MRIMITGAGGFVGGAVYRSIKGDKVGLVRDEKYMSLLSDGMIARGDLADARFVKRVVVEYNPDIVIHLAASAIVNQGVLNPSEMYSSNLMGTVNLLEACRSLNKKDLYFHYFGTDKALGQQQGAKEDAQYPWATLGPYEQSKAMGEAATFRYSKYFETLITRCANIYGPGDRNSRLIPNDIRWAMEGKNALAYNKDKRQYVYIDDVVSALALLREKRATGIYHIGSPDVKTTVEVAQEIADNFPGCKVELKTDDVQAAHKFLWYIHDQSLNWDKLAGLGWTPQVGFSEGIRRTIAWWKSL